MKKKYKFKQECAMRYSIQNFMQTNIDLEKANLIGGVY